MKKNPYSATKIIQKKGDKKHASKDELLEELTLAFDDIKHGRIKEWKPRTI